jgi:tetratricopeptide (TPR) repeat protein
MTIKRAALAAITVLLLQVSWAQAEETELGSISFPNSGAAEAQSAFLSGVKALHSFQFGEARLAFEEAQKIDPSFALAYWGQAMSDNHPLWAQQDAVAAEKALKRLAPTFEARLVLAPTEKEKAFMDAVETLYFSADDKLDRDFAYSARMEQMHERWPDDHEISIFYALSLLGTVRRGDQGFRRQAKAAAISQDIFAQNESHPGAAHFIIHSFDDPDHAILAYPAAEVYAGIAPAAAHALHMPSHIFVQMGLWQRVVDSNIEAYAAAMAGIEKYGFAEGREDFHTLSWLAYAYLMLGENRQAAEKLVLAHEAVERNPKSESVYAGYLGMRARHMIETGEWEQVELEAANSPAGMNANWVTAVGMSAAKRGDQDTAMAAAARLRELGAAAEAAGKSYDAKQIAILEKEVIAIAKLAAGDQAGAVNAAREAAEMELRDMNAPSGPPIPMKPAVELYGDILLATGQPAEAKAAYERSLQWIPLRTPSVDGLAQSTAKAGGG